MSDDNKNTEPKPESIEEIAEKRRRQIASELNLEAKNVSKPADDELIPENKEVDQKPSGLSQNSEMEDKKSQPELVPAKLNIELKEIIDEIPPEKEETNTVPAERFFNEPAKAVREPGSGSIEPNETLSEIDENAEVQNKLITDFDAHLFNNGTYYKIFEKFGAQITAENGENGVRFTTWAPNADSISIIGEFNGWQEGKHEMFKVHESGVWSAFIAGMKEGDTYKFSINSNVDGVVRRKIDPYAFRSEHRPKNACVVHDITKYKWNDDAWLTKRDKRISEGKSSVDEAMNIYELHLGSWKKNYENTEFPNEWGYLSYGQLAREIVAYVKQMGYTHIELMPVMEHPLDISWGYQVTHYFAPSSRFGDPDAFMYFIDHCHQNGIGVILDWVPAHFPSDEHALAYYDGKQIYGYENMKKGFHKDWNTYVFDYSRPQVRNFLISSALFWFEKYHVDGLRVDAVASMLYLDYSRDHGEWEPNIHGGRENLEAVEFLKHLNDIVHNYHPYALMIAEESTSWPGVSHTVANGGLGFDMKWNMGWMNDILLYFSKDPIHRKFHQGKITFSLWYAFSENFVLPISHDEVVHGKKSLLEKMPGDTWQKFANLRLFLGFMMGHPGKKLNFMTTDIAQYNEWNSEASLEWNLLELVEMNKKFNLFASDLNNLYTSHEAMYEVDFQSEGFQWVDFSDALNSILSFYRTTKDKKQILLFTFNMTPTVRNDYTVGVPEAGYWKEIFNSDAEIYGGSGIGNMGGKESQPVKSKNWENSIIVTLPPLAVNIYEWTEPVEDTQIEPGIETVEDLYVDTDTGGGG
jgi:1,4-alpha-glucan branching enzyme